MVLVLAVGLLGGLTTSSTVSADPVKGTRIQIPRIDMGDVLGGGAWSTKLQIQNVGDAGTWVAVIYWGAYSDECPPNDTAAISTYHKQYVVKDGIWTLTPLSTAKSAIVCSLAAEPTSKPTVTTVCNGQPLAVTVDRWGPDVASLQLSSSYVGISEAMEGASGSNKYYAPYIMYNYLSKLDTVITIQNSGTICTSVWIWYKEQGNCEYQVTQHITELAPGEAIRVGPGPWGTLPFPNFGKSSWLGSAYISSEAPLGIIVDQLTLTTPANNQAVLLTFRGQPYEPAVAGGAWGTDWYADLLYREVSGWDASIQVQNLTQTSVPTFVTVDFMNESGDEILMVGDWICRNGGVTFYLPAITDLGVNHPFGYVGAAEIASVQQIDYPGHLHDHGEPIFVVVDMKKRKLVDPVTGLVRPTIAGENQGGAYNAHPKEEKLWAYKWAMPYVAMKDSNGVTSKIALRNNSNCNKFYGKIWFYDQTGAQVGVIHTPWLFPKHLKVFDLAYEGFLYPGWVGAAEFEVLGVEQLCDQEPLDGVVDNLPIMPSVVVMNYGWEAELGIAPPATDLGDLTRVYEGIPVGYKVWDCYGSLFGTVTLRQVADTYYPTEFIQGVTVSTGTTGESDTTNSTGGYGIPSVDDGVRTVTFSKTGFFTATVPVTVTCGAEIELDRELVCANLMTAQVSDTDSNLIPGATVTITATYEVNTTGAETPTTDRTVTSGTTNNVGIATFEVAAAPDGTTTGTASAPGHDTNTCAAITNNGNCGAAPTAFCTLCKWNTVVGSVLFGAIPAAGYRVDALRISDLTVVSTVNTTAAGLFTLENFSRQLGPDYRILIYNTSGTLIFTSPTFTVGSNSCGDTAIAHWDSGGWTPPVFP